MRVINFRAELFTSPQAIEASEQVIRLLLEALVIADQSYLRMHPHTPALYQSGVRYVLEDDGAEDWQGIAAVLKSGEGDCEDLAAWRAAEIRNSGQRAAVDFKKKQVGDKLIYHIFVRRSDGSTEDPSRVLGMGEQ